MSLFLPFAVIKRLRIPGLFLLIGAPASASLFVIHQSGEIGYWGLGVVVLTHVLVMAAFRVDGRSQNPSSNEPDRRPPKVRKWIDVRATADPVASSSTRAIDDRTDLVVHNLRSVAYDHTSYWQNWSEFVPIVINAMTHESSPELGVPRFWTLRERSRRYELTWMLAGGRVFVAIAFIAVLIAAFASLKDIGTKAMVLYATVVGALGTEVPTTESKVVLRLIGCAVVLAGFAIAYRAAAGAWHWWQGRSERRQVGELCDLQAEQSSWQTWVSAAPCRTRSSRRGWLVVIPTTTAVTADLSDAPTQEPTSATSGRRTKQDSEVVWVPHPAKKLGDATSGEVHESIQDQIKVRPRALRTVWLTKRDHERTYFSDNLRSAAFLKRVYADPSHR